MAKRLNAKQWSRISVSTDGRVIQIRHNNLDGIALSNMLYAILKEIPHSPQVMKFVLDKFNQEHEHEQGISGA